MRLIGLKFVLLVMLFLPTVTANAVEGYVGLATGFAVRQQQNPANDHMDSGEKIYFGVRLLGPVAFEFAAYDLGQYENQTMEVEAMSADVVFNADIRGMSAFFKAGIVGWKETDLTTDTKDKGQDVTFGFGIDLAVDRHVVFRTEIERFRKVGKDDATNDPGNEMTLFSFGVNFRF